MERHRGVSPLWKRSVSGKEYPTAFMKPSAKGTVPKPRSRLRGLRFSWLQARDEHTPGGSAFLARYVGIFECKTGLP